MNPELSGRCFAQQDLIHADTEHIYSDAFFEATDAVTNALDNVKARAREQQNGGFRGLT